WTAGIGCGWGGQHFSNLNYEDDVCVEVWCVWRGVWRGGCVLRRGRRVGVGGCGVGSGVGRGVVVWGCVWRCGFYGGVCVCVWRCVWRCVCMEVCVEVWYLWGDSVPGAAAVCGSRRQHC